MKSICFNGLTEPMLAGLEHLTGKLSLDKISVEALIQTIISYFESIIGCMPGNVYWLDAQGIGIGCNENVLKMFGLSDLSQFKGLTFEDMGRIGNWSAVATESFKQDTMDVILTGNPRLNIEEPPIPHYDGHMIHFLTHRVPLYDSSKKTVLGVVGISIDITKRKEMEVALHQSQIAAETANHAKTEFIANMSHDIRTPLSGVVGMSQLLEENIQDPDLKQYARWIHESGEQLLGMLNGILDVVSADNVSENDIREGSFDLRKLIQDIVHLERPTTTLKHLALQVDIDEAVPLYIVSDRTKLHRILLNLLGNAIKFTQKGRVKIEVKSLLNADGHAQLRFCVADTGIGIPSELQTQIFDRFFRATPSYKGTYAGHGVGLHIAQLYVRLLGGDIQLLSEEGVGTTFYFDLSVKIGNKQDIIEQISALQSPAQSKGSSKGLSTLRKHFHKGPRLLLIEDNMIALHVLESMASKIECDFVSASNGEQALELSQAMEFDLIIADIGLPGMSGHEFTRRFREWEHAHHKQETPIVGLTAHVREQAKNESLQAGMNDVFTKPINVTMLQSMINRFAPISKQQHCGDCNTLGLGPDLPNTASELFELNKYPLLDINSATESIGGENMVNELLQLMANQEIPNDYAAIQLAYAAKNWADVEKIAHKMKGGAMYCGTIRMKYACQYMERYHKAGQTTYLEHLYHQLIEVIQDTSNTIKNWL